MRAFLIAAILGSATAALALPMWIHMRDLVAFSIAFDHNGMTPANPSTSWPVAGVPAPTVAWWGDDEVGSGTATTYDPVLTGTDESIDTPFCISGSWDDVTAADCMTAQRLGGSNDYYLSTANPGPADPASGDMSVCALFRTLVNGVIASQSEGAGANGEGWYLYASASSSRVDFNIENHAGVGTTANFNTFNPVDGAWQLCCGTSDFDGNVTNYCSASADGVAAGPGGVQAPAEKLSVGAAPDGGSDFTGDVAFVFWWNSLLSATHVAKLYQHFVGIQNDQKHAVAFTNTGPVCEFVDGAIECYGDDMPILGGELAPGMTGAGAPADGMLSVQSYTNSAVYSRALGSWTLIGTPAATATSTDLFRDGRQTVRITDNDGAAVEGISQAIDITALDATDTVRICIYAKDSTGTVLDLQVVESGVCGGSTIDFVAKTIDTAWKRYAWTHTVADGTCTTATYKISPTSWAAVADTGSAEFVAQVFLDKAQCPPIYCESAASAVVCGDTFPQYTATGTSLFDGAGKFPTRTIVSWESTPANNNPASIGAFWYLVDSASAADGMYAYWNASTSNRWRTFDTIGGTDNVIITSQAAEVQGTTYSHVLTADYLGAASGSWLIDGVNKYSTGVDDTDIPDSLDTLTIGSTATGTSQFNGWISNVEFKR